MVSLVPFSTAWVADTKLAAVPVFVYAAVFVLVNLRGISRSEWHALASAPLRRFRPGRNDSQKSARYSHWGLFVIAMLVALKFPSLGFGLICCALLV